jgi:hypothetical protein
MQGTFADDTNRWTEFEPRSAVFTYQHKDPKFFSLRSVAIRLHDGSVMVVSPIGAMTESEMSEIQKMGPVRYLLCPNHFHSLGIKKFLQRFSDAKVLGGAAGLARLRKVLGIDVADVETIRQWLPDHIELCVPEGLKSGEVWFKVWTKQGNVWIVSDAYFNMNNVPYNLMGLILRAGGTAPGFRVSRVFRMIAVKNKSIYRQWVQERASADQPIAVVPSHGDFIVCADLGAKVVGLI